VTSPTLATTAESVARVLGCTGSGPQFKCLCPAHDDSTPSLSVTDGLDGQILFKCFAGCSYAAIKAALAKNGIMLQKTVRSSQRKIAEIYDYCNAEGLLEYQVVRLDPKSFRCRRPTAQGEWIWNRDGVKQIPYRLPEVIQAVNAMKWIFVVEGEKDVNALAEMKLTATCNSGGAGNWPAAHAKNFCDANVAIIPDNDDAGRRHALQVAQNLLPVTKRLRLLDLPGVALKGDVSDFIGAGSTRNDLIALVKNAPDWNEKSPEEYRKSLSARDTDDTKPDTAGTKPNAEETKPDAEEIKAKRRTSKADVEDDGIDVILRLLNSAFAGCTDGEMETEKYVPFPYFLNSRGIGLQKSDNQTDEIAGPLIVTCLTRGTTGRDYGLQIAAEALDGRPLTMNIPAPQIHGDPADLARVLAEVGVRVVPKQEKSLMAYLDAARINAAKRRWVTSQPRLGWADGNAMAYVFPEVVLGAGDGVFQPERANRMADCCVVKGTLVDWQRHVADLVYESDLALFVLCSSFAGAILRPAGTDSFGLNLAGITSRGKTTALQIAASVWGNGSDPGTDSRAYCRRWTATANALEAIAEEHSDMALCLDEIGSFRNADELGRAVYNLAGGRGAERLNSSGQRRTVREWRTIILSSGEIAIRELMRQRGQHQRGGQALRVLDIPFPQDGLFPGRLDAAAIVRKLKQAASDYCGIAGREFVRSCIDRFSTHSEAREWMRVRRLSLVAELATDVPPEITRAADRFALVHLAGELAIDAGILHCPTERLHAAMTTTWALWRAGLPDLDDGKRAIAAIADYIKSHPGQFPSSTSEERLPYTVAGYLKTDGPRVMYLLTEEGFASAIGDIPKPAAIAALEAASLLFKNDSKRKVSKHALPFLGKERTSFYAVLGSILAERDKTTVPDVPDVPGCSDAGDAHVSGQPRRSNGGPLGDGPPF
jgi:putative DNA primase/helicase